MTDNRIRFKQLAYVCLDVADLAASARFYEDIAGLQLVEVTADRAYLRCSDRYFDVMLCQADQAGLRRIGFLMESPAALEVLQESLLRNGREFADMVPAEAKILHVSPGFSTWEPTTGVRLDFVSAMEAASDGFTRSHTKIVRMGHVVIGSPDLPACSRYFEEELNFRVSDRIGDFVVHMRCFPNPLHHSFGIGAATKPVLHHLNFMVTEIDDIGRANVRMQDHQVPIVFGPGRHPQSNSFFFYFLDPDGLTLEYSFGVEEFPERDPRPPRDFPMTVESGDYWGGRPRPGFAANGEINHTGAL